MQLSHSGTPEKSEGDSIVGHDPVARAVDPSLPVSCVNVLGYQTLRVPDAAGVRPRWVYAVFAIYGLIAMALLTSPIWGSLALQQNSGIEAGAVVTIITLLGLSLMILPVKVARHRGVRRRALWIPIICSGLLAGILVTAAAAAWIEYSSASGRWAAVTITYGGLSVWLCWSIVFISIAFSRGPESIGMLLHRSLIAGSVLELLVAVPTHLVVRRRSECCAGILTGTAICLGLLVMFLSLGPSVVLLYWRRRHAISKSRRST